MNVLRFMALLVFAFLLLSYASFVWRLIEKSTLGILMPTISSYGPVVFVLLILAVVRALATAGQEK